ncbi:MAG: hypothetical protein A2Z96_07040 [Spirochaetes bacterium GWB1_48_6]|nr:MAG: hypothetical protein A2Z96_07040 [Spirochaetes bacterium GWB1_48_6]
MLEKKVTSGYDSPMKKPSPQKNKTKNSLFFFTFLLLILAFPLGLEALLRLTGAGIDTYPFVHPQGYEDVWVDNPPAYQKYYPKISSREGMDILKPNIFNTIKDENILRGFVLGGSTAQGFPFLANQSFSKIAEASLGKGEKNFEILNLGRSAMSSYYIRDMAGKLLDYDPDFLVIYAGHNEYYGTISASTGGNHFLKLLNLKLKESRVFQLLFDALSPTPPSIEAGQTRMAQQFADKTFLPDPVLDRQVAEDFLDNIKAAARPFLAKGLPVFIYLPVSNLEMPPFNSEKQGTYQVLLEEGSKALDRGDLESWKAIDQKLIAAGAQENAHRLYLKAINQGQNGSLDWNALEMAKDRDTSPFRAKSLSSQVLGKWASEEKGVVLIDTAAHFLKEGATFTREYFIDHLHFNFKGQKVAALALSRALGSYYGLTQAQKSQTEEFYATPDTPEKAVFLTDYFSWRAITGVEKLLATPPYKFMILPADFGLDIQKAGNPLFENKEVREGLVSVPSADQFSRLMSWYSSTRRLNLLSTNLFALAATDRGNPGPPRMLAELYERSPDPAQKARAWEFYLKAYLLSHRDPLFFNRLRKVMVETNQKELYEKVNAQYGPKN